MSEAIKHVVVLMLENRSFDHMLGSLQPVVPGLDGIDPAAPRSNVLNGVSFYQTLGAARTLASDPKHEHVDVMAQLAVQPDGTCANSGFVSDFARAYPTSTDTSRAEIMKYFALGALPATHGLGQAFTVCDRWFSSLPGPTWPNRFFVHSGTSIGRVTMPQGLFDLNLHWYSQTTIYDRLNERNVDWKIYHGDMPQSLLLVHQLAPKNLARYAPLGRFFEDLGGDASHFPAYAFIEPEYSSPGQSDDHPPHDILAAERLIADVYNGLRDSAIWNSVLLVVVWDEHGGFYDHVPPPKAVPPDFHQEEFTFDRYGVRVPAILVSPFVAPGVCHSLFDHTSILRFATDLWKLGPLGNRVNQAVSLAAAFSEGPVNNGPQAIFVVPDGPPPPVVDQPPLNDHQRGLIAYSQYLASLTPEDPVKTNERNAFMMTSARAQLDTACDHFDRYLSAGATAAGVSNDPAQ